MELEHADVEMLPTLLPEFKASFLIGRKNTEGSLRVDFSFICYFSFWAFYNINTNQTVCFPDT